jgi:ATP-dependent RNA helicase DDX52/ROK1
VVTGLPAALNFFSDHLAPTAESRPGKQSKRPRGEDESDSDSESEASSSVIPHPPQQKITITGSDPLPKSLHSNLPSLVSHETSTLPSSAGRPLLRALDKANIHSLWGVQCAVGGCLLEGKDTICVAPTGSGKTLSYVLPTIVRLGEPARNLRGREKGRGVRALVLVPTHDLAVQIHSVIKAVTSGRAWRCMVLSKATEKAVCESSPGPKQGADPVEDENEDEDGGMDDTEEEDDGSGEESDDNESRPQSNGDRSLGIDILIATPERLHHLLESGRLSLVL